MKNAITGLGIVWIFPILFLSSCQPSGRNTGNGPARDTVVIQQMQFIPAELQVTKGDTVVWINKGMVDHNVTEEKTKAFYSDTIHVGKTWKMAVTSSAGYFCSIHPTMKGTITIK